MASNPGPVPVRSDDDFAAGRGAARLRPEHLYKFAGLLFLLALLYRYFDPISRALLLVLAAAVLAVAFNAIIRRVPGKRNWLAALLGLLILGLIGVGLWFAVPALAGQLQTLAGNLPEMQAQIREWSAQIRQRTGLNIDLLGARGSGIADRIGQSLGSQQVIGRAGGILELLFLPLLILFGALYAAAEPNRYLLNGVLRSVSSERRAAFHRVFELTGERLLGWIKGTLFSILIVSALSTGAFYLLGLDYALVLGVWSGVVELVPIVGPFVGGFTAIAVALTQDPQKALWTGIVVLIIQQLESDVITPMVMAGVAKVHPFVTLFAIFLFGSLFGFLGVLLALPLVLTIWTVVQVLWVERAIDTEDDRITPVVEG